MAKKKAPKKKKKVAKKARKGAQKAARSTRKAARKGGKTAGKRTKKTAKKPARKKAAGKKAATAPVPVLAEEFEGEEWKDETDAIVPDEDEDLEAEFPEAEVIPEAPIEKPDDDDEGEW